MKRLAVLLGLAAIGAAPPPSGEVVVAVDGMRSAKGLIRACLTAKSKAFPDCRRDPAARRLTVLADDAGALRFAALPSGRYAVSLLHDENGNGRADMALLLPREGFGFSRDAPVRFGPPKFARAAFRVSGGSVAMPIRMRYLL
jgi:uncharacterized protein (DUF2141 family)